MQKTLVDVLIQRKFDSYEFLNIYSNAKLAASYSYEDLYLEAHEKACKIKNLLKDQKQTILVEGNNDFEFFTNFFAAQLSGNTPVPVTNNLWITESYFASIIKSIVETTQAQYFLCSDKSRQILKQKDLKLQTIIDIDWEFLPAVSELKDIEVTENDLAFIQFSSGSTGNPKGVKLTHKNVIANLNQIADKLHSDEDENRGVSWLPVHHDMGLIGGFLLPFYNRYSLALMTPYDFAVNPNRWLKVITETKGNLICAPNSGYHMTTKRARDKSLSKYDLSSVRHALCGAEPINIKTLKAFVDKFSACGFKESSLLPCYGMAENTLAISFHCEDEIISESINKSELYKNSLALPVYGEQEENSTITFVSSGKPLKDIEIVILNENDEILPERCIGQIAIKSPSMTNGYYNREDLNEKLFTKDGYLKTGDLGYLGQGRIFVTGRMKDVIIINGLNINAEEIEAHAIKHPKTKPGRLVAISSYNPNTDSEEICLLVETKSSLKYFNKKYRERVKRSLAKHMSSFIPLPTEQIKVLAPGSIVKTTSGKVKRNLMKKLNEQDKLQEDRYVLQFLQYKILEKSIKGKILLKDLRNELNLRVGR